MTMKEQLEKVRKLLTSISKCPDLSNPERDADWKNCTKWNAFEANQALTILDTLAQSVDKPPTEKLKAALDVFKAGKIWDDLFMYGAKSAAIIEQALTAQIAASEAQPDLAEKLAGDLRYYADDTDNGFKIVDADGGFISNFSSISGKAKEALSILDKFGKGE